jgi:DNA-binding response OmpR family regulator
MAKLPKILVAEDDGMIRKIIEEVLFRDYELHFSEEGNDALNMAVEIKPELIILDVMMPGMDGFEICKKIREQPALRKTIVIMLTALTDSDSQKSGINAGADDYLTKPFNPIDIRTKVSLMFRLRNRLLDND